MPVGATIATPRGGIRHICHIHNTPGILAKGIGDEKEGRRGVLKWNVKSWVAGGTSVAAVAGKGLCSFIFSTDFLEYSGRVI